MQIRIKSRNISQNMQVYDWKGFGVYYKMNFEEYTHTYKTDITFAPLRQPTSTFIQMTFYVSWYTVNKRTNSHRKGMKMYLTVITPSFIIVFLLRIIIPTTFLETLVGIFLSKMSYARISRCKHLILEQPHIFIIKWQENCFAMLACSIDHSHLHTVH
jgi:hypothetical protein